MTWLSDRVGRGGLLVLPGVYDALTARIAAAEGVEALYSGGYAVTASQYGLPDIGLLGLAEMVEIYRRISRAVPGVRLIVDADTGYGGVLNVQRTVESLIEADLAGCHIEDQATPKRCGHIKGKAVVDQRAAVARIRAAVDARGTADFAIIARTDALAVCGFDDAVQRAKAFLDVGADAVFIDALQTLDQIRTTPALVGGAAVFNAAPTKVGPVLSDTELAALGYALVIHPIETLRIAAAQVRACIRGLMAGGGAAATQNSGLPFAELNTVLGLSDFVERERRISDLQPAPGEEKHDRVARPAAVKLT